MASRVVPTQSLYFPKRKPAKSKDYLAFLHRLPCIITRQYGVEAAHLSMRAPMYGHYGRGRSTKAPDRWALPLCSGEHARQHDLGEEAFWDSVGINPHLACLVLWGLFAADGDAAEEQCVSLIQAGVGR